jgi:hypothetical protein
MVADTSIKKTWIQKTPGVCGGRACVRNTDAVADNRAVLTHNDIDFKRLHRTSQPHEGIISCTQDPQDPTGLAQRIDAAVMSAPNLGNQFVRIVRPNRKAKP